MERDFSVIHTYLAELWDLISHFDKLDEVYDWLDEQFEDPKHNVAFQARKHQYKRLRDDVWRWLRDKNLELQRHYELERGPSNTADCPVHWEAEARRLVSEVENAVNELRRADAEARRAARRAARREAWLNVAPDLFFINTV